METLQNYLAYIPKRIMALIAVLAVVIVPTIALAGFGPDRPTFTWDNPADYVVFNSMTDNPEYGDERSFFDVKKYVIGNTNKVDPEFAKSGGFDTTMQVADGDIVMFRAYVHNNASSSLNADNGKGIATGTSFAALVPEGQATAMRSIGYISADNAQPKTVSDTADLFADTPFSLEYLPGTATMFTESLPNGIQLSDTITGAGAPLGQDQLNGEFPGCFDSAAIVTYFVRVNMESYNVDKQVRLEGQTKDDWKNEITAQPGETVEYRLEFENESAREVRDVILGDNLPNGVDYVQDSTVVYNGNHPSGTKEGSNNITSGGINVGHYNRGANVVATIKAQLPTESELECGTNRLVNQFVVKVNGSNHTDTATVVVDNECEEPDPQVITCDALSVNKNSVFAGQEVEFTAKATATNGATIDSYDYNFGDGNKRNGNDVIAHTYQTAGTYKVTTSVKGQANGEAAYVPSPACQVNIIVNEEPVDPIMTCDALTASPTSVRIGKPIELRVETTATPSDQVTAKSWTITVDGEATRKGGTVDGEIVKRFDTAGTYEIQAVVSFAQDGQDDVIVTSENCKTVVEVTEEPVTPIHSCDALSASKTELTVGEEVTFTVDATAENGATLDSVIVATGDDTILTADANGNNSVAVNHTYTEAGSYAAGAQVVVIVDGEAKTITNDDCVEMVEVEANEVPEEPIYRCVVITAEQLSEALKARVTVTAQAKNGATVNQITFDYGDASTPFVTNNLIAGADSTQTAITEHVYAEAGDYTIEATVLFDTPDGQEEVSCPTPVSVEKEVEVCEHDSSLAASDANCKADEEEEKTTSTPTVLPNTGAGAMFFGIFGTSAIGTMLRTWVMSRRALRASLLS